MTVFSRDKRVWFHHCDPAGIVFYPHYLLLLNEVQQEWFEQALGVDYGALFLQRGLGIPTVRLDCEFLAPSRLGDTLRYDLRLTRVGTSSFQLLFECADAGGGAERARFRATLVCVSLESGSATPLPGDLRSAFSAWLPVPTNH